MTGRRLRITPFRPLGPLVGLLAVAALIQVGLAQRGSSRQTIKFQDASFHDELYPVNVNNRWGFMNQRGNLVVFPQYDWTDFSYEGLSRATLKDRTGYLNGKGEWRIQPKFPYADRFEENHAVVGDGERFGFIDQGGKPLTPIQFDGALRFREGYAAVCVGKRCGFINTRGDVVIPLNFSRVRSFHDGLAMVEVPDDRNGRGMLGYITKSGRLRFLDRKQTFNDLGDFNESFARARVGDFWGYIDEAFRLRIEPRFEEARDFVGGLAAVKLDGKWGYIDQRGEFSIAPRFERADDFDDVLAMVKFNGEYGYIDRRGDFVVEPQFTAARPFFRNFARVTTEPSFGYIDIGANVIWDPRNALEGFIDITTSERARIAVSETEPYNRRLRPPPAAEEQPEPYPPEHLYEEVLPQPRNP